jgi:hypothetical protein
MRLRSLATVIALTAATPAAATDWWYISDTGAAPDRRIFIADRDSIQRSGDEMRIRARAYDETPDGRGIAYRDTIFRISCRNRQSWLVRSTSYGPGGAVLENFDFATMEQQPNPIQPGTPFDGMLRLGCNGETRAHVQGDPDAYARNFFR